MTSVHVLRKQRFTLRMLARAAEARLLDVDLKAGQVVARRVTGPASSS